jgi:hypothetical protein
MHFRASKEAADVCSFLQKWKRLLACNSFSCQIPEIKLPSNYCCASNIHMNPHGLVFV